MEAQPQLGELASTRVVALDKGEPTEVDDCDAPTSLVPELLCQSTALLEEAARSVVSAPLLGNEAEVIQSSRYARLVVDPPEELQRFLGMCLGLLGIGLAPRER